MRNITVEMACSINGLIATDILQRLGENVRIFRRI